MTTCVICFYCLLISLFQVCVILIKKILRSEPGIWVPEERIFVQFMPLSGACDTTHHQHSHQCAYVYTIGCYCPAFLSLSLHTPPPLLHFYYNRFSWVCESMRKIISAFHMFEKMSPTKIGFPLFTLTTTNMCICANYEICIPWNSLLFRSLWFK